MAQADAVQKLVGEYGAAAKAKLSNPASTGQPEDQLRNPLETLFDLSQSGARIVLGASGKVGGGLLRWLGFEAFGDLAWQSGEELALHFDETIDSSWLIETRRRAPGELNVSLHARRAAREWVSGRG